MNKITILAISAVFAVSMIAITAFEVEANPPSESEADLPLELKILAALNGNINPQANNIAILFFGDTLCKIEGGNTYLIKFGMQTTVQHDNQSCLGNGERFSLEGNSDAVFQQGDVLVVTTSNGLFTEVYREQTL